MAVALLLDPNIRWDAVQQKSVVRFLPLRSNFVSVNFIPSTSCKRRANFSIGCSMNEKMRSFVSSIDSQGCRHWTSEPFFSGIVKSLELLKKSAITALLLGIFLMGDFKLAMAASGGRMGGESFSSRSSSSSGSYSTQWASPSLSYSLPCYGSSPFGFGNSSGICLAPAVGVGSESSLFKIILGVTTVVFLYGFLSDRSGSGVTTSEKTSILKLQVGMLGSGQSLQRDLDQIARVADTSTSKGLHYILTETTLALLRHPDYWVSSYSSTDVKGRIEDAEKCFNGFCMEERGKFDEETLVNVNNLKRRSTCRTSGFCNEYIVVTIIGAVDGAHKLPTINCTSDLKAALQILGSVPLTKIRAVEVLWTPQDEHDTLLECEFLENYPLLRTL